MNIHQAEQYIDQKYPHSNVQWIDKGQMNFIAVVDELYVYKFPKKPDYFKLLNKEYLIYKLLDSKITLDIPRAVAIDEEQQFLRLSYVKGSTPNEDQATSMSSKQRTELAIKLSTFIKQLNTEEVKKGFDIIAKTDTNDFYYVENWLKKIAEYCKANPSELADKYTMLYAQFSAALPYGFCVGNFLAHKDLHEDNMLFDDNNNLVGLIDFAEVRYTSIYSELRTVVRFGTDGVQQIIDDLGALAGTATASDVQLFAKIYELAIVIQDKYLKNEISWRVNQANYYLKNWKVL